MNARSVGAGNGWEWIREGFGLFRRNPVIWIALFLIYLMLGMVMSMIPVVGPILLNLLAPVFMAGFMLGCQALESGEELEINHLFAGFRQNTAQLITVGGLYLVGVIAVAGIVFMTNGGALMAQGQELGLPQQPEASSPDLLMAVLLMLGLLLPLVMAYWFAPTLVIFHNMGALDAMRLSFFACLRNLLPFLVYSVISMLLLILAALPLGLGLFIMIPTMTASLYASYKDIFSAEVTV